MPYGVIVDYKDNVYDYHHWKISSLYTPTYSRNGNLINTDLDGWITYEDYKGCGMSTGSRQLRLEINLPFLRSISTMTEEEKEEIALIRDRDFQSVRKWFRNESIKETGNICPITCGEIDYCNKKHFDYRGLIPMGLAIEAPEGMY